MLILKTKTSTKRFSDKQEFVDYFDREFAGRHSYSDHTSIATKFDEDGDECEWETRPDLYEWITEFIGDSEDLFLFESELELAQYCLENDPHNTDLTALIIEHMPTISSERARELDDKAIQMLIISKFGKSGGGIYEGCQYFGKFDWMHHTLDPYSVDDPSEYAEIETLVYIITLLLGGVHKVTI